MYPWVGWRRDHVKHHACECLRLDKNLFQIDNGYTSLNLFDLSTLGAFEFHTSRFCGELSCTVLGDLWCMKASLGKWLGICVPHKKLYLRYKLGEIIQRILTRLIYWLCAMNQRERRTFLSCSSDFLILEYLWRYNFWIISTEQPEQKNNFH